LCFYILFVCISSYATDFILIIIILVLYIVFVVVVDTL